jgi:hypothetical protein
MKELRKMSDSISRRGIIVHGIGAGPDDDRPWIPFPECVAYLRNRHCALIADCVAWSAARNRPLDPNVIALLCGAAEEGFNGGEVTRWTVERVYHMLCCHIPNWCDDHHFEAPDDGNAEALWAFLSFLVATDRFDDESDPAPLLLQVLRCFGINSEGLESDDEADWHTENAPFEYDGPTHGELKRRMERS